MKTPSLLLASAFAIVAPALAQQPPALQATRDLTIDAAQNKLTRVGWLGVARDGGIVLTQPSEFHLTFFSSTGAPAGSFGKQGEGNGEFQAVLGGGWIGDSIWVNDNRARRIVIISPQHKAARVVPTTFDALLPTGEPIPGLSVSLNGGPTTTLAPPISAVYSDGTVLVSQLIGPSVAVPAEWHRPTKAGSALLRLAPNGVSQLAMGWTPAASPCGNTGPLSGPFCPRVLTAIAGDGHSVTYLQAATTGPDSGTYTVTTLGEKGDTILARKLAFASVPVPQPYVDSVLAVVARQMSSLPPAANGAPRPVPTYQPTIFPPVTALVVGRDGTIWIGEVVANGMRPWLVLDEKGNPWGTVRLPANITVRTADRTAIWGTERTDTPGVENVVRYSLNHSSPLPERPVLLRLGAERVSYHPIAPVAIVRVSADFYRLWDPRNGAPVGVISYAVADDGGWIGRQKSNVDLTFRGSRKGLFSSFDTTVIRPVTFYPKSTHETGFVAVALRPVAQTWNIASREAGMRNTSKWQAAIEPLGRGPLELSDVVLGAEGQQVIGMIGVDSVVLAPHPVISRGEEVAVYFQLRSDTPRSRALTTIRVMRIIGATEQLEEVLSLGFRSDIAPGITQVARGLDVSHLAGSRYFVDVTVNDSAGHAHATQRGVLDLRN